ncbi:hypothetical protein [Mycolicibacterium arenosum]|uniref:Uncharacterized protein n=1 Tax=Mycolicibacterium arenosum TaxID=2952157 RepID=A0ABT1LXZ0_9MYCO|nr:hypothetical protein [Mycolicibacterium sp. CAU 1645]MCP9271759.1 hypothetical protein [Mycolicibacterium sp. CAU 1645]
MALRPLLTAGIAVASAGVLALTPTIVPQLTEAQKNVVAMAEEQVTLAANLQDLINVFFGVDPAPNDDNIPPVTDAAGTAGFPGLIYQLLSEQQGGFAPNRAVLDQFFQFGLKEVVRQQLLLNNPSNAQFINDFFDGGLTQLAYRYASSGVTTPNQQVYLDYFFNQYSPNPALSGFSGVSYVRFKEAALAGDITPEQAQFIEDLYVNGGFTAVVRRQLLSGTSDPVQRQFLNDFFDGGVTQVVRTQLLSSTQDPQQLRDIALFFPDATTGYEGGITENIQDRFLAANSDPQQQAIINAFFDEGVAEVVRLLLVGPKPVPDEAEETFAARTFTASEVEDAGAPAPAAEPGQGDAEQLSAPAPAPAAPKGDDAPPVAAPVAVAPAADPTPNELAKSQVNAGAEEDATEAVKDGNKAEVTPILPFGSEGKSGSGSWGVFGQVADAIGKTIAGAGGGAQPGADGAGAGGDAGGGDS